MSEETINCKLDCKLDNFPPSTKSPETTEIGRTKEGLPHEEKKTAFNVYSQSEPGRADKLVQTGSSTAAIRKVVLVGQRSFTNNKEVSSSSVVEAETETIVKRKAEENPSCSKNKNHHHHTPFLPAPHEKHERKPSFCKLGRKRSSHHKTGSSQHKLDTSLNKLSPSNNPNQGQSQGSTKAKTDMKRKKLEVELKAAEEIARIKETVIEKRLALELASLDDCIDQCLLKRFGSCSAQVPAHVSAYIPAHQTSRPLAHPPANPPVHQPTLVPAHLTALSSGHVLPQPRTHVPEQVPQHALDHAPAVPPLRCSQNHHSVMTNHERLSNGMLSRSFQGAPSAQDINCVRNPTRHKSPLLVSNSLSRPPSPHTVKLMRHDATITTTPSVTYMNKNYGCNDNVIQAPFNYPNYAEFRCDDEKCEMAKRHSQYHQNRTMKQDSNNHAKVSVIWKKAMTKMKQKMRPKSPSCR